jgi:two-component system sensor histidine kinase PilS (NtrC family)
MALAVLKGRAQDTLSLGNLLRNQILWMLLLRIILYTLLLAINFIFEDAQLDIILIPPRYLLFLLLLIYVTTIFSAFFLLIYQGSMQRFGFIQTLLDTFFASILVYFSGSSASTFTTVFFFPIIASGLILPRRGGLLAAASATLLYGFILFLETSGYPPRVLNIDILLSHTSPMTNLNQFAIHGLTFFLAAILSELFGFRLKTTENALSASIEKFDKLTHLYKKIFDNISTGIITIESTGRITSANNALEKITGLHPLSLIGKKLLTVFPGLDLHADTIRLTTDFTREDGRSVRIGYSHMLLQQPQSESEIATPPDKIITLRDISEIEKLEQQVRQTEKLAAIGMMSASIAHDFRNPLTAISGSAQVLANEFSSAGDNNYPNYELANIILRESGRLTDTIGDFLKFSRPENITYDWFSIKGCFAEVFQVLEAAPDWPPNLKVSIDLEDGTDVWGDERQMFTVLSQLVQNAIPFCPLSAEKLAIRCREIIVEDHREMIEITLADNGTGIEKAEVDEIFEPFYTSRADGTGLGLAIVRQIIGAHQGTIGVANEGIENYTGTRGALFTVRIPLPPA